MGKLNKKLFNYEKMKTFYNILMKIKNLNKKRKNVGKS